MFEDLKKCGDDNIYNGLGDIKEELRSSFHIPTLRGSGATADNCCGAALLDTRAARHGLVFSFVGLVYMISKRHLYLGIISN